MIEEKEGIGHGKDFVVAKDEFSGARAAVPSAPRLPICNVESFAEEVIAHRVASMPPVVPHNWSEDQQRYVPTRSGLKEIGYTDEEIDRLEAENSARSEAYAERREGAPFTPLADPSGGVDPGNKYTAEHNKLAYDLLPIYAKACAAAGFKYGRTKYMAWNWTTQKVTHLELAGAMIRHFEDWLMGQEIDSDSSLPHFAGMLCSAMMLVDNTVLNPDCDDRPRCSPELIEAIAKLKATLETRLPQIRAAKRAVKESK
jgi:hypothetical protein